MIKFSSIDNLKDRYKYIMAELDPVVLMNYTRNQIIEYICKRLADKIADKIFEEHFDVLSQLIKYDELEKEIINEIILRLEMKKGNF